MKFKKLLSVALCTAIGIGVLAGCGQSSQSTAGKPAESSDAKTTITFWHSMGGVNGEALTHLVDKFNSENDKGIHVDAQYQGEYDDSINKLKSAQLGNMGADVVQIYDIGTRFMIDSGWIVPMQELIDKDKYDISKIEPNIAAYYTVDNKLYSMPFNSSTPILYYNKDMFNKAGID
ncbi:MAG: extracellular solute-binding protein, partial [Clostridium butyricum]